jgi:hypothetical protein
MCDVTRGATYLAAVAWCVEATTTRSTSSKDAAAPGSFSVSAGHSPLPRPIARRRRGGLLLRLDRHVLGSTMEIEQVRRRLSSRALEFRVTDERQNMAEIV